MSMYKLEVPSNIREFLEIPGQWLEECYKSATVMWVDSVSLDNYVVDFKVCTPSHWVGEDADTCWCEAVVFERGLDDNLYEIDAVAGDDLHGVWDFNINGNKYSVEVVYA
jgi:hypothetical protein